jgi:hypothetical protein
MFPKKGMPANSYRLIIYSSSPAASHELHDVVVRSVILYEATLEVASREGVTHSFNWNHVIKSLPAGSQGSTKWACYVCSEAQIAQQ